MIMEDIFEPMFTGLVGGRQFLSMQAPSMEDFMQINQKSQWTGIRPALVHFPLKFVPETRNYRQKKKSADFTFFAHVLESEKRSAISKGILYFINCLWYGINPSPDGKIFFRRGQLTGIIVDKWTLAGGEPWKSFIKLSVRSAEGPGGPVQMPTVSFYRPGDPSLRKKALLRNDVINLPTSDLCSGGHPLNDIFSGPSEACTDF